MHGRMSIPLAVVLLSSLVLGSAHAAPGWPHDPNVNVLVGGGAGPQCGGSLASDGHGGAYVVWINACLTTVSTAPQTLSLQHILRRGAVDPAWPAAGLLISTTTNGGSVIPDGSGGVLVGWDDVRAFATNGRDVYMTHVRANGTIDPAWPAGGLAVCTAPGWQTGPNMIADGAGGAFAAWVDRRDSVTTGLDIYAAHVKVGGVIDPAWPANGRVVCNAANTQTFESLVRDGTTGFFVTWQDRRNFATSNYDVYAQHVHGDGTIDPAWPANGLAVSSQTWAEDFPTSTSDGSGGLYVAWQTFLAPGPLPSQAVILQHVLASGAVDPSWPTAGVSPDPTTLSDEEFPILVPDGANGVLLAWTGVFGSDTTYDVGALHFLANGTADPLWPSAGRQIPLPGNQTMYSGLSVSDGQGGLILEWDDDRTPSASQYAVRIDNDGKIDANWIPTGVAVTTAPCGLNGRFSAGVVTDSSGGAIYAWSDQRDSAATGYNTYAQLVTKDGRLGLAPPSIDQVRDVPGDQGGKVTVYWTSSSYDTLPHDPVADYEVWRLINATSANSVIKQRARPASNAPHQVGDIEARGLGAQTTYWEFLASIPALATLSYAYSVATTADSSPAGIPWETFEIVGRLNAAAGGDFGASEPDSGYSVDNLAPPTPSNFIGQYTAGTAQLSWDPSIAVDLAGYRVYRGTSVGFAPSSLNRIASPTNTHIADAAGGTYFYKLTAIDIHGNESAPATLLPTGAAAADELTPTVLALARPSPSPASDATMIRLSLPQATTIELAVFDASGRRVRTLLSGARSPGIYASAWDLRDDERRPVATGVYFIRLDAGSRKLTTHVVVMR
jgi:hypothetical protein